MLNNFETIQKQGQENFDLAVKSINAVTKGFQEIAKETADFSKKQFETSSAIAEKLLATKSIEKAVEVQADFAKSSYESFVSQATKIGELYAGIAKEAYKPFESIAPKVVK
jgi:hypothetical protein